MKLTVTGGKGFIGSHLCPALRLRNHQVQRFDKVGGQDLLDPGALASHLDLFRPDRVIHLAAQVGRVRGEDDILHTVNTNAAATTLLARLCEQREIPVTYTSSSEIYGDQGASVCYEATRPVLPHNLYGLTKRWGEEVLQLYVPKRLQILRLSMPYGPGAPPGRGRRALDNILWQAHHRKRIPIHRGAERSWCHINDAVRAMMLVIESGKGGAWNVGRDDRPVTMEALALMACDLAEAPYGLIDVIDPPSAQTVVKRLSTDKLTLQFGWQPKIELLDGLQGVYHWVQRFDRDGNFLG